MNKGIRPYIRKQKRSHDENDPYSSLLVSQELIQTKENIARLDRQQIASIRAKRIYKSPPNHHPSASMNDLVDILHVNKAEINPLAPLSPKGSNLIQKKIHMVEKPANQVKPKDP